MAVEKAGKRRLSDMVQNFLMCADQVRPIGELSKHPSSSLNSERLLFKMDASQFSQFTLCPCHIVNTGTCGCGSGAGRTRSVRTT
jgi:hypothetical protein